MCPTPLKFITGLLLLVFLTDGLPSRAGDGEEHLLLLRNGGRVCGIAPFIGGRVVLFRTDMGENVLDGRPSLWTETPPLTLMSSDWKQYFGESTWAGPQADWWTLREPYPPKPPRAGVWPPDPAWELAPFNLLEKTPTKVVMQSPVSALTGLQLTKTVELLADGRLRLQETATNRGDRVVTRDLWMLHRVPPNARCLLPLKSETEGDGFADVATVRKIDGLTVIEQKAEPDQRKLVGGKMMGEAAEGWMASSLPGTIFKVSFQPTAPAQTAPGQAPVELYERSAPEPLCEMEHHGPLQTLKPGDTMANEEFWQILLYPGADTAEAEAHFLQASFPGRN